MYVGCVYVLFRYNASIGVRVTYFGSVVFVLKFFCLKFFVCSMCLCGLLISIIVFFG